MSTHRAKPKRFFGLPLMTLVYVALIPFINWSFTWAPLWEVLPGWAFNPVTVVTGLVLPNSPSPAAARLPLLSLSIGLCSPSQNTSSRHAFYCPLRLQHHSIQQYSSMEQKPYGTVCSQVPTSQ